MNLHDFITFLAVLVALFGARIWRFVDNIKKRKETQAIIRTNLMQLHADLMRMIDENKFAATLIFDKASFSEVNGYDFLFTNLMLPNMVEFELSGYPSTIKFFNHYRINMEAIKKRLETEGTGHLSMGSLTSMMKKLEAAIAEFR
jgi:hypothetical protein